MCTWYPKLQTPSPFLLFYLLKSTNDLAVGMDVLPCFCTY